MNRGEEPVLGRDMYGPVVGHDPGCLGSHLGDCAVSGIIDFFQCPRCHRITHHLKDIEEGYCSACHDWTRLAPWVGEPCGWCGEPIPDGISVMIRKGRHDPPDADARVFHVPCAFHEREAEHGEGDRPQGRVVGDPPGQPLET